MLVKSEEKNAEVLDRDKLMSATQELTDIYDDNDIEDVKEQKMVRAVAKVVQSEFSGPIPPPNMIKGYEAILPGAADRIITMAEKQSSHRQEMERKIISADSRDSLLGILFAWNRVHCGGDCNSCISARECRCYIELGFRCCRNGNNYRYIYKKHENEQ